MEAEECMDTSPGARDDSSESDMEPTESADVEHEASARSPEGGIQSSGLAYSDMEEGEESMDGFLPSSHVPDPSVVKSPSRDELSVPSYDAPHSTGVESHPVESDIQAITPDASPPPFQEDEPLSLSDPLHESLHRPDREQENVDESVNSPTGYGPEFSENLAGIQSPTSPKDEYPASPDGECPASPDPVSSDGECPDSDGECPASPGGEDPASKVTGPASPDGEGLSSQYENIASVEEGGPMSPDYELASLEGDCPASPDEEGPASPGSGEIEYVDEGPHQNEASIAQNDSKCASPKFEGISSDEEGQASDDDDVPTSSLNTQNINSKPSGSDNEPTSAKRPDGSGDHRHGLSSTHHHQRHAIQESAKVSAVQDTLDMSSGDSQRNIEKSSFRDHAASPDGGENNKDSKNSLKVQSVPQWPTTMASSPISDTEEIWDDPSITENKSDNDDSGSCVKSEKRFDKNKFQGKSENTIESSDTLSTIHSSGISPKRRKPRKEIDLRHVIDSSRAAKMNLDVSENISSSTDAVHRDYHLHSDLDRISISRDRKEHKHDKTGSTKKNIDSLSQNDSVAESTSRNDAFDEGRMRRVKENTSFNEEHVELDYEEDVTEEVHGHHNDISREDDDDADGKKDGSDDEKV